MTELLSTHAGALLSVAILLGLVVGSFINVVILRLPQMMRHDWECECREMLGIPSPTEAAATVTLYSPPSACPACGYRIPFWQNVPIVSWLLLRGRCSGCSKPISLQYPLVEAASAVIAATCAVRFGWSIELLMALVFSWTLLTLAVIDARTMLLPDSLTLPLMWLGLLLALIPVFVPLERAVLGAAAGYLSLWSVYHLFKLFTGKEGMGFGDFKLLAALGAWMGWQALPLIIVLSSLVGAVVGIGLLVARRMGREVPIPFGPYLAGAGWLTMLWGDDLRQAYFSAAGF